MGEFEDPKLSWGYVAEADEEVVLGLFYLSIAIISFLVVLLSALGSHWDGGVEATVQYRVVRSLSSVDCFTLAWLA